MDSRMPKIENPLKWTHQRSFRIIEKKAQARFIERATRDANKTKKMEGNKNENSSSIFSRWIRGA